jgi:SWI/SNF-related matrix-associated actin-dependent regulator 1 of chromatin subfamily A
MLLTQEGDSIVAKFGFNKNYQDLLKTFKGARFDGEDKRWIIPMNHLRLLCRAMREKGYGMDLCKAFQATFGVNKDGFSPVEVEKRNLWLKNHYSNAVDKLDYDESSLGMPHPLLPYQRAGIFYAEQKNGRILLADDMGLGKTIQAIGIAKVYKSDWPVVVVAPASLLLNWKKELVKWLPHDLTEDDVHVMKKGKDNPRGKVIICSYDYTKNHAKLTSFLGMQGVLLVDEAHNIKTYTAKRSKSVIYLSHFAKRVILMTGTPVLNRVEELFSLVHAINPHTWGDYDSFVYRYCNAQLGKFGLDVSGLSNEDELFMKLREDLMCRRLKNDVLKQLPDKLRTTMTLDVNKKSACSATLLIEEQVKEIIYALHINGDDLQMAKSYLLGMKAGDIGKTLFEAYRLTGLAKIDALCDWIGEKISGGCKKIVIFGHHKDFLDGIENKIISMNEKKKGDQDAIGYMRIDGSTSKDKRFNNQESFQTDESCNVAILSINAANSGLTLTEANVLVMGELPWTPGVSRQAEDRVHRIGQKCTVNIYYTIAEDTFDGALWNMLKGKSVIASKILDYGNGDEMEEEITISSPDLLTALMVHTYQKKLNGDYDIPAVVAEIGKRLEMQEAQAAQSA